MKSTVARFLIIACCLCWHSAWGQSGTRSLAAAPLPADVRLLIDVSGSMKDNDPQNLRRPAVDLLVKLLPEESRAGIWSFGSDTLQLVPHAVITDDWRQLAAKKAVTISSHALFTDIGAALEAAAGTAPSRDYRTSIILLTDGVVDITKDAEVNRGEWQRIVNELLPRLQSAGFVIHTIALSENADQDLLKKLAVTTGGLAAVADEADELLPIFLKILDTAAPSEKVALEDNEFQIDPTIEEFTALIFHELDGKATQILDPAGESLDLINNENLDWHRAENYDLATVKQPAAGKWQVLAEAEPDSRVTVVSTLSLRLRELPTNVYKGQSLPVSFAVRKDDTIVTAAEFLSKVNFEVELQRDKGAGFESVWNTAVVPDEPPASGIFNVQLPKFGDTGDYRLLVRAEGESIQREVTHNFSVRVPFEAEITAEEGVGGSLNYLLILRSNSPDIQSHKTQVAATILSPEDRRLLRPMALTDTGAWELQLRPRSTGRYHVDVTVTGVDQGGIEFRFKLEDLSFYYSPERGFIKEIGEEAPAVVELPEPEPEPEAIVEPEPETSVSEPEPIQEAENPPQEPEQGEKSEATPDTNSGVLFYISLVVGNLLLIGFIIWGYRKLMGSDKSPEEILAGYDEKNIQGTAASSIHTGSDERDSMGPGTATPDLGEPEMDALQESSTATHSPEHVNERHSEDVEELLADATSVEDDAIDEASLDEALASILGELDMDSAGDKMPPSGSGASADVDDDDFGLDEDDIKGGGNRQ